MNPPTRLALILIAAAMPASAQYTATQITFNHPAQYTQEQLEAVAGIHPGMKFTSDDLGNAEQHFVDSGYFDTAGVDVQGMTNAATIVFDLKPTDRAQMLHVGFENFVWLTHAEIEGAIHAKSALFLDYLPESSPLDDIIDATLTEALAAKGITAKVTHDTIEPTMLQPERVLQFRIASPAIRVVNIKLGGVTSDLTPLIQKSVNSTARTAYNEGRAGNITQESILAPLRDAGYLQASLDGLAVTPSPAADNVVPVVLSATLNPGDIFHVSSLTFAGTPLLSADSFASTQKLHPGDIASRKVLLETLEPLDAAYRKQGFMDVVIKTSPQLNASTHQVAYTVTVEPGEPYRMKEITTKNLDPLAQKDFDRGWLMKTGELYSPDYATAFLKKNTALLALAAYSASYKAYADPNTHTVDLVITFYRSTAH